jgi:hypothetical protein
VQDPVYFQRDIRVTFQQIGWCNAKTFGQLCEAGRQLFGSVGPAIGQPVNMKPPEEPHSYIFERTDDWSSCCYFYLDRPENNLPPLAAVAERTSGLLASSESVTVGVANP